MTLRKAFIDTSAGQVFALETGSGEPLLLLHQSPRTAWMYERLMGELSDRYRTIAIDMLGYGLSPMPPVEDGVTDVMHLARNCVEVLDALGVERAHVFGFHTGAMVAVHVAAGWPERVGALVLGGIGFRDGPQDAEEFLAAVGSNRPLVPRSDDGSHLTSLWTKAYSEVVKWWLLARNPPEDPTAQGLRRSVSPFRPVHTFLTDDELQFIERYITDFLRSRNVPALYQSTGRANLKELLPRIDAPTLHIDPGSPFESPFSKRGERVAALLPRGENVVVEGGDDNMVEFLAPELALIVGGFLARHPLAVAA
jgi:pimeloyl-ACP methyl ester carboxylesterase